MKEVIDKLEKNYRIYHATPASQLQIEEAETGLSLQFTDEYKLYLSTYGALSFESFEFMGLNVEAYLNVVDCTIKEKQLRSNFPEGCYVVQSLGIEGVIIVQDQCGKILQFDEIGRSSFIAESLTEYLNSLVV